MTVPAQRVGDYKNCQWIYRFQANPGMPRGGVLPPTPVLAPGSASGRVPALPYPPPRSLQFTPEHGHHTIQGGVTADAAHAQRLGEPVPGFQVPPCYSPAFFPRRDLPRKIPPGSHGTPSPSPTLRWPGHARYRLLLTTPGPGETLEGRARLARPQASLHRHPTRPSSQRVFLLSRVRLPVRALRPRPLAELEAPRSRRLPDLAPRADPPG